MCKKCHRSAIKAIAAQCMGEVWRKAKEDKQEAGIALQEIRVSLDEVAQRNAGQAIKQVSELERVALPE